MIVDIFLEYLQNVKAIVKSNRFFLIKANIYGVYTHQNIDTGACCVQDALDIILKDEDKQQILDNIEKWGVCVT